MCRPFVTIAGVALLLTTTIGGRPGRGAGPAVGGPPRVDRHGDPLPAGAVARLGTVRWRPTRLDGGGFDRVRFSPDGTLVVATWDRGLGMWEAGTGKPVAWAPDAAQIRSAAFSPDGQTLIAFALRPREERPHDPTDVRAVLEHWEVGTGRRLRRVEFELAPGQRRFVFARFRAFSADGKFFLASPDDERVCLWDAHTGKLLLQFKHVLNQWDPIGLSPDNRLVAGVGRDGHLLLYDRIAGTELRRIPRAGDQYSGYVFPAFSPDGKLVAASTPRTVRVWDTATGELRREFDGCRGPAAFSADGKHLACGDRKGIRLWETASFQEVRRFEEPPDDLRALAFSADGRLLASATNLRVGLWDVATGKRLPHPPGHPRVVHSLTFTPSGAGVVSGGADGAAIVWDLATATPRHRLTGHFHAATAVACSPDGKLLATGDGYPFRAGGGNEAQIRLWSLADGALVRQFTGHLHNVHRLAFSPDGTRLASAGLDARFRVWDPATGRRLFQVRGADGTRTLAYSPDGRLLALGHSHGELGLFRADTGQKVRDLGTPQGDRSRRIELVSFAGDGRSVISEESGGEAGARYRVWDAASGREVRSVPVRDSETSSDGFPGGSVVSPGGDIAPGAISPDGDVAATVAGRGAAPAIQLWDLMTGKQMGRLRGHAGFIPVLAFSPDGKRLASGSGDTTVLVWDVVEARMRHYWAEVLAGTAEAKAAEALAADPPRAAKLLRDRLARSAEVEVRVRRLIRELDHDEFAVREKASRELARLAPAGEAALRGAAEGTPSAEVRQRIQALLGAAAGRPKDESVLSPERVRMAVAILENMAAPDARQALGELARGPADTAATREARAALDRLKKTPKGR